MKDTKGLCVYFGIVHNLFIVGLTIVLSYLPDSQFANALADQGDDGLPDAVFIGIFLCFPCLHLNLPGFSTTGHFGKFVDVVIALPPTQEGMALCNARYCM